MTDILTDEMRAYLNELVVATVTRVIDHAPTPSTRSATVQSTDANGIVSVIMDGETDPVGASNASGITLSASQRVQVVFFPPHAAVVIGELGGGSGWAVGDFKASGAASQPGWLLCNFAAYSRSTYSDLFQTIGTTYGAGDGSTTFNVPDLRGRTILGAGTGTASGATAHALGSTGGEEKHTLITSEIPAHNHPLVDGGFGAPGVTNEVANAGGIGHYTRAGGALSIGNTGGGGSHNTLMPFTTVNIFIKF